MNTKTQFFIDVDVFDELNVHDIAIHSFRLNHEMVSPQLNEKQYNAFMRDNPSLSIENGDLLRWGTKIGLCLEYTK